MMRVITGMIALAFLAACQTTTQPSESYYRNSEAMRSAAVERCRVLEVREVSIGAEEAQYGYGYRQAAGQPEEQIATVLGAALGAALGSQVGKGDGKILATSIGAAIGGAVAKNQGSRMAQHRMTQAGLEYSIMTAGGREEVIVQHYNPGDRIASPGSTCRLTGSGAGQRVLPGDQMPSSITRPNQTRFSN